MEMNEKFLSAVENKSARQAFIDGVGLEGCGRYVRNVRYDEDGDRGAVMSTVPHLMTQLFGKGGLRSEIIVYPDAFSDEYHENVDDFLGTLIDHEGMHAKQNYDARVSKVVSIALMGRDVELFHSQRELECFENQIANFGNRDFSDMYKRKVSARARIQEIAVKLRSLGEGKISRVWF